MGSIPDQVRRQALHPFSTLPLPPGWRLVEGEYVIAALHPLPFAQPIEARGRLAATEVDAAIDEARAIVRSHGAELLIWLTGPGHPWLAGALAERGLRSEDTPGFESVESAMAVVEAPLGPAGGEVEIEVVAVESFEAYAAGVEVELAVFELPPEGRAQMLAGLDERWAEYTVPDSAFRRWNARLGDRVVGTAGAVLGDAGVNMIGGGVLPAARGNGVYRALVNARWEAALERGTPALTVQAGRMSRPVLERLGFQLIGTLPLYVEDLSSEETAQAAVGGH
jgi:GNAT superfamily N-acetyltransferase